MDAMADVLPSVEGASFEPVKAGGVPCEWVFLPNARDDRVVLYYHGGGYIMGSPASHRTLTSRLAEVARCRVLSVDYRLAPEAPFPAAVEDGVAAYAWLLENGFSASQIGIAGDSAGGGLTVAALLSAREQGLAMPACAIPISPWVDLTGASETMETRASVDPMVQKDSLVQIAGAYLGGKSSESPLASPIFAELSGLPPLLIQVGDHEVLLGDAQALHEKAMAAGVESTLEVWDDMFHVWHMYRSLLPEGDEAIVRMADYLEAHWSA